MPNCFVIMGYGQKNDLATGRMLNLDATYKNIIKPAVEAANYKCIRADEIRHAGLIDVPMYDMLFDADLVVADLSTSNINAIFELGIRHALKPRSTIIIAEKQFNSPFDINHVVIRKYEHLGTDIGFGETMRMRQELQQLIEALAGGENPDSPVYTLVDLVPPARRSAASYPYPDAALSQVSIEASYAGQLESAWAAKSNGDFAKARQIFQEIYDAQISSENSLRPGIPRPRVVQELAVATYMVGKEDAKTKGPLAEERALLQALEILRQLDPDQTTDPETLGVWAAVYRKLAKLESRTHEQRNRDLDMAIYASERGFLIRQDGYNGTNLAHLLDYRASRSSGDDRIADRVQASRVRRRIVATLESQLAIADAKRQSGEEPQSEQYRIDQYWLRANLAEALIALSDPMGARALEKAMAYARETGMAEWRVQIMVNDIERLAGAQLQEAGNSAK